MTNENKYEPKNIFDIVYGNEESQMRIEDIVSGVEPLPSFGKCAILLYGVFGTGKTTLANMLPDAIEFGKTQGELAMPLQFIACQQGFNGPQVMTLIESQLSKVSLNASGLHYFVIDEVDNLTKLAQQSLKSALNTTRAIFILTTNNVSQLDKGLMDRCVLAEMNAAQPKQLAPLIQRIAADANVVLNATETQIIAMGCNGSVRNLAHTTMRYISRKQRESQARNVAGGVEGLNLKMKSTNEVSV